ncbi:MAG: ABC transporter permease [Acidimicrobiales bacterium]
MAADAAGTAALYGRLLGARIRSDWQYRTSFFLYCGAQFLAAALDFVVIVVLFTQVPTIAGWSLAEMALLYGVAGVAFNLADVIVSPVEVLPRRIKDGTFDLVLTRPLGTLLQLATEEFAVRRAGKLVQAVAVLVVAAPLAGVAWTPARAAFLAASLVAGTVIFSAVWVLGTAIAFWTVETQEMTNSITYGGTLLSQYPLPVFAGWLRRLVVFVVPLAFVGYLPTLHLLGRADPTGLPNWAPFLSPAVAAVVAYAAARVWTAGARHYQSTGS